MIFGELNDNYYNNFEGLNMFYLTPGGWLVALISVICLIIAAAKKKKVLIVLCLIAVIGIVIMGFSDFRLFWVG